MTLGNASELHYLLLPFVADEIIPRRDTYLDIVLIFMTTRMQVPILSPYQLQLPFNSTHPLALALTTILLLVVMTF